MNALDQEIAIAKICGWTHTKTVHNPDPSAYGRHPIHTADVAWDLPLPDYLADLNAMHEAEKVIADHQEKTWIVELERVVHGKCQPRRRKTSNRMVRATAAQRAEAFLRTLNKWEVA